MITIKFLTSPRRKSFRNLVTFLDDLYGNFYFDSLTDDSHFLIKGKNP